MNTKPTYNEVVIRVANLMEDYKCPKKALIVENYEEDFEMRRAITGHLNILVRIANLKQSNDELYDRLKKLEADNAEMAEKLGCTFDESAYPEHPLHEDPMND